MTYIGSDLNSIFSIEKIYSIHYFEYMSNFKFAGESHDFWEFICVDKGEVEITAGTRTFLLKKGDIAFHEPNEFHNVKATGTIAPNLVVVSFSCHDEAMQLFRRKVLRLNDLERTLLASIITEARNVFDCRFDDPYLQNMPKKEAEDLPGSEQLIRLYLEQFLIFLTRDCLTVPSIALSKSCTEKGSRRKNDLEIFHRVAEYMDTHLSSKLTIHQICRDNLISRSQLQKLILQQTNMGIIEYFSHLKVNAAKEMIRSQRMNFTQISDSLGYSSIHYFSRQFKKITGMTPSEYASSIKAISEREYTGREY